MRAYHHLPKIFTCSLLSLLTLLVSCTGEDAPEYNETVQLLAFTVTDGNGYASATQTGTRAIENGYTTEFTDGDACGLYIVRGTEIAYDNIKLTATADASGNMTWSAPAGTTLAGGMTGEQYFLYYPYQSDMSSKTATTITSGMDDADFFEPLISSWQPATDQSTYCKYTASDLMTARGTVSTVSGGVLTL